MRMPPAFCLIWSAAVLGGCRMLPNAGVATSDGLLFDAASATRVAADLVPRLQEVFSPGTTIFSLPPAARSTTFGQALDVRLRHAGYAVASTSREPEAVPLAYETDRFGEGAIRVVLVAGDAFQASRLYERSDDGVFEADSGFTERREPVHRPRAKRLRSWANLLGSQKLPTRRPAIAREEASAALSASVAQTVAALPSHESSLPGLSDGAEPVASVAALDTQPAAGPDTTLAAREANAAEDREDVIRLNPDSDNVIEISAALFAASDAAVPNPFVQHYQPKSAAHEFAVVIAGIALGPQPSAVLNGRVYSVGESIEGFRVTAIRKGFVTLRRDNFVLKIPLQEQSVIVRYP